MNFKEDPDKERNTMKPDYISKPDWDILTSKYSKEELDKLLSSGVSPQYLIGNVEFLNTTITIDKRVLIPRFETETLVDKTIKYASSMFNKKVNIIDLGTGSGCIAIALKKNLDANLTALDISSDALDVAKQNAILNNTDITFINQSMTDPLNNNYDIIISNPPYIPYDGYVEQIVKNNEPSLALYASDNGLYFYKYILNNHLNNLNKPGLIAFEIGDNQRESLEQLVVKLNLKYSFEQDLQGLDRYLFIFNE